MDVQIHARNLEVTPHLRDYLDKKLNRLDRYLPNITQVQIDLAHEHHRQGGDQAVAQLTIRNSRGAILRAEDKKQTDIFAALDVVTDKMYQQISRYKGKQRRKAGDRFAVVEPELASAEAAPNEEGVAEEQIGQIVRHKQIELVPMNEDEAVEQLELLGHDFFMFFNAATGAVNVIYRRQDGNYGVLEPAVG
ncbi:MAG TPA: ribosome-associated translation inhibitor RaiA [Aggregatilineaceae bacterium]|nr:ribosome-associated translation inhibitor RaiA [Aggregatilineaceae bacterium]